MSKPTVGILTAFTGADRSYSLINVVSVQMNMLMDNGYKVVLFTAENFRADGIFSGKVVEIRRVVKVDEKADVIAKALLPHFDDIDVVLAHDLVFLGQYANIADAVRMLAEACPWLSFLHWQHSRGDHAPIKPVERSWFCYPNMGDLEHVAEINSTDIEHVKYVPHPLDFDYLGWPRLAIQIADDFQFHRADVSMILPSRMDRQKQVERVVRIFAGLKRSGKKVCFLVAEAHSTGERFVAYKNDLKNLALEQGLTEKEFAFLGDNYQECIFSTPHDVIKALFEMSNVFVQASNAETSSLVVMEAALAGNVIVLNADFPPIHHLYKDAITLPFGSIFAPDVKYYRHVATASGGFVKVPDDQMFWDDEARNTIIPVLEAQMANKIKRQQYHDRWPSTVFTEHIEPLIEQAYGSTEQRRAVNTFDPEVTAIVTTLDNLPILKLQLPVLLAECGKVIVVNNGSVDGTQEYLALQDEPRMITVNRENKGAGPGRNAGLDAWAFATPYTLMVDGGIIPPVGGVKWHKDYLNRHPEVHIISPEVNSCFTTDRNHATLVMEEPIKDTAVFSQRMLSSTAYCLARADVWKFRFSEEGPFGEAGWGADDNDMQYQWNEGGIIHYDYTFAGTGIMLYRRGSGSFQRLYQETGIWPNQYGSVYEERNVKLTQDWLHFYDPIFGAYKIAKSFVIAGIEMPELAYTIKKLHDDYQHVSHEIIVMTDGLSDEAMEWLTMYRYRWPWGNTTVNKRTNEIVRRSDANEATWTGNFNLDSLPKGEEVVKISSLMLEKS